MKLRKCFIASAGHGTRMGEIGKLLPKPLWPIFDKTILDLQLDYLAEIGISEIFLNAHHLSDQIMNWAKDKNVEVLPEKEILGSGGCIHNLKSKYEIDEKVLIINADQFLFFKHSFINEMISEMSQKDACAYLLAIKVDGHSGYNETVISNNQLVDIDSPKENSYYTYSGVGLLDLEKLDLKNGPSSFFNTVCNYKEKTVLMREAPDSDYWDFGTIDRYVSSMKKSIEENQMNSFLKRNNVTIECQNNQINMMNDEFILDFERKEIRYQKLIHSF